MDTVKSGFAAIERLQNKHNSQHYDLVFIDNKLDDIDGISAAREIQQLSLSQPPAVILMTEFHQKASISASTGSEITGFLEKPITESDLFDVLIQQLHKNQTYTSKKSQNNWKIEKETTLIDAEILLVEDNLINQEIAIELLQQAGMKVTTADNGKQAISILEEKHFDAVLMDLQMPVMGGLEATELIRKKPRFYQLPIIAMTANTMASDKEKCIASGMNDHIGKPINPKDLFATLSKWIVGENPETPFNQVDSVEPLAPESAEEIDLPHHITALDMACALKHMQGKKALLQKVLLIFAEENCHDDEKILNALNNHEFDQAQMLIHTLKGLTATIGALPLHEYCKSLDAALKNQDESIYDELQHQISIHFKKLLQELLPWAESIKNKKTSVKNSHNEARICTSDILHMPITAGGVAHENLSPPLN
ncbi:MAG: response regulator [Pseudomonadales bacterium]|nr:response regulator [Pseudomonadales bacterium]